MGLLLSILTAPITGPLRAVIWTAEQIQEAAERELYDVGAIQTQLATLGRELDAGEIDEATFAQQETLLLDRLDEALDWQASMQASRGER